MKCSVCMASYNGEKYIREQIDSILQQLSDEDELVVSDDGSQDGTVDIIRSYHDPRIHIIFNTGEHGYTSNFENALRSATGDYIFITDQDDIWLPDKYSTLTRLLLEYDFVVHDCKIVDQNLHVKDESFFEKVNVNSGFLAQMIRMRYLGCCMAFRRCVLDMALPFPPNHRLVEHDTWLASLAELYFHCVKCEKKLILYRRHDSNTSGGGFGGGYSIPNKIYRRAYRLVYLAKAGLKFKEEREWKR